MAELKQLDFYLLRYVPNAVRGEFVNIGLIMIEASEIGFAEVRFTQDLRPAERLDPQIDIEVMQAIERHIRKQFQEVGTRSIFLKKMEDSFSNLIQLSPKSMVLMEEPAKEIEALASFYFKTVHQPSRSVPSGRSRIWQQMRTAFEQHRVLPSLLTDIPMEKYTESGDPLKLDFAYAVNENLKVFQAVSLKGNLGAANYFGSRARGIVEDLAKKTRTIPLLTAVVDDDWDRENSDVKYAVDTMSKSQIAIAILSDMPKIAELARIELRL